MFDLPHVLIYPKTLDDKIFHVGICVYLLLVSY